jgi:hypothetical protein
MALTYNQITAITEKLFLKKLTDGIYDSNAIIKRLNRPGKKMVKDGGEKIVTPIIYSKPGEGGWYTDLDVLSTNRTDNISAAEYEWKQLHEPIRVSRLEMLKNNGDAAKLSLIAAKTQIAEKNIRENLAVGLFSSGAGKLMTGLDACISTTSTYGSIAVADFAQWIAVVNSNAGDNRPLTLALVQQFFGALSNEADKPTVFAMRQNVYDQLHGLFQPHQRLNSAEMSKLGFENVLTFNGVPCIVDSHVPANTIIGINEDYFHLCVHREEDMRKETIERMETSNSMLFRIFWAGNAVCTNRRYQGKISDLEVAA